MSRPQQWWSTNTIVRRSTTARRTAMQLPQPSPADLSLMGNSISDNDSRGSEVVPSVRLQLFPTHEQCRSSRLTEPGCVFKHFHEKGRVARLG